MITTTLAMPLDDVLEPAAAPLPRPRRAEPVPGRGGASPPEQLGLAWGRDMASRGVARPAASRTGRQQSGRSGGGPSAPPDRGQAPSGRGAASSHQVAAGSGGVAAGSAGTGPRSRPPGPRRPAPRPGAAPTPRAAGGLLRQAVEGLAEAQDVTDPLLRYPAAYLSALRAGAAVLAVRATPQPKRGAGRNVWRLLADVAPELGEWAAFFASCSGTRAAAEAGIARLVGQREADDLLRQAEQFVDLVRDTLGVG